MLTIIPPEEMSKSSRRAFMERRTRTSILALMVILTASIITSNLYSSSDTIFSKVSKHPNLRILRSALVKTQLDKLLSSVEGNFTLFAPTDDTFENVFEKGLLTCVSDYFCSSSCTTTSQLLSSTSLRKLLLNHVTGNGLLNNSRKESLKITKENVLGNVQARNGVIHLINRVLGSVGNSDVVIDDDSVEGFLLVTDSAFFNLSKRKEMAEGAKIINIPAFQMNRNIVGYPDGGLTNSPVLVFDPSMNQQKFSESHKKFKYPILSNVTRPVKDEDIAFMTVVELGALIRSKQVTSVELVKVFTQRLKRYDNILKAVVTYTVELAHKQALAADKLISQGTYLGPLHGIPYGIKDTMAVPGYKTTWGCKSFKNQEFDGEAGPYTRLKAAGAVLIAKLAPGSLAYDDIWFGGRTRNPWNIEEYSTGSSAGPAASTSSGNVPFSLGSETAGSITYPAARTGVTALRPTFGLVSRTLILSVSESLDKIGPFARSAEDCAIIFDILRGKDLGDLSSKDVTLKDPFAIDVKKLTVGYLADAEMEVVNVLREQGVHMVPFKLEYTVTSAQHILNITMHVDMLSHFDHWQRAGLDDEFEAQYQWPVELRTARLISAVDYVQAQRARHKLITEVMESMKGLDAFVGNATDWEKVAVGNLVGMPVVVVPVGLKNITNPPPEGTPRRTTVTTGIYSRPYGDSEALALAMAFQRVTKHHLQRPPVDNLGPNDFHLHSSHSS